MSRKGIILAGGSGTRLHPLTLVTSKQLLPVYDKPMIYYPLSALMLADIRDVLIITTPQDQAAPSSICSGAAINGACGSNMPRSPTPNGLAQAFVIGADFVRGHSSCLILGDNIIYGHGLPELLLRASERKSGATLFGYWVDDPERYGVIEFEGEKILSIEEKPQQPKSNWAAIGLYFYDEQVVELAKQLKPSARGEYEITDLNNLYIRQGNAVVERLGRGFAWLDAGTYDSLVEAAEFIRVLQRRQGQLIAAPEEIAFHKGWIDAEQLEAQAARFGKTQYGARLLDNCAV